MPQLHVTQLAEAELARAYPLIRSRAGVTLDHWLGFVRGLTRIDGGVLAARAKEGCYYGLAAFAPLPHLQLGRVLGTELIAAIELGRTRHTRTALCAGLEHVAADLGCRAIASLPVIAPHDAS